MPPAVSCYDGSAQGTEAKHLVEEDTVDFVAVMDQTIAPLRQRGRATYRTLQIQLTLNDEQLAALKDELLYSQPQVTDDARRGHSLDWRPWYGSRRHCSSPRCSLHRGHPSAYTPTLSRPALCLAHDVADGRRRGRWKPTPARPSCW